MFTEVEDATVTAYMGGVAVASTMSAAGTGDFTLPLNAGDYTISASLKTAVPGTVVTTRAAVVSLADAIDNGEVMWFNNKATTTGAQVITVADSVTGVQFTYINDTNADGDTGANIEDFDHFEVPFVVFTDLAGHWSHDFVS